MMFEVLLAVTNVAVVLCAGVAVFAFWKANQSAEEVRRIAVKISEHLDTLNEREGESND
jgi:hypothetical protein